MIKKIGVLNENTRIAVKNITGAFVLRGAGILLSFVSTPAFIAYFHNDVILGVWYTVLSILTWFLNFDFGIGNGVRNDLARDIANKDEKKAKRTISSGMFVNFLCALCLYVVGCLLINIIDLNWLYGVSQENISNSLLKKVTNIIFIGIMVRFFLSVVTSIWYALQKSFVNNLLSFITSVGQFLFVLLYKPLNVEEGLIALSIVYVIWLNVPILVSAIIVFASTLKRCKPNIRHISRDSIRSVLQMGMIFFSCQVLYVLIMNSNEILISNIYGPEYTTHFSFYYKLTNVISMFIAMATTPIWSLVTKAASEKQYIWLRKLYRLCSWFGIGTIILQFAFIPFEQFLMDFWLKSESIKIEKSIAIAFACFGGVFVYQNILSTFVCGLGRMRLQLISYAIGIIVKMLLVFLLHNHIESWSLVVWSNVIVLVPYCIIQQLDLNRFFRKRINFEEEEE